ncbi:MAG: aldehyde ferredoxin oxidoreductase N-terminal domain-containing protein, partial [Candidatus Latescibacteria bacterium]|nr:aldehyde ferredoxin oxidoreductase N-terminal domain-containing protein [Candidatus Latescibacterota bacterium]
MPNGYMGKQLFVELADSSIRVEEPDDSLYRDFIGCYGIGARVVYDNTRPGISPLGPDNMLGLVTGPLTGTPAFMGSRFQAVGKSPLTGGWGDANAGGHFGPRLKFAGFDDIFFTGIADDPVYLFIDSGKAELRDAGDLWGKDVYETEEILKSRHGGQTRVACIGPAGENLSLAACIINEKGASAGRSGLGAVMGSKKIKAVVVRGTLRVPIADMDRIVKIRDEQIANMKLPIEGGPSAFDGMHKYGTSETTAEIALNGDTPIRNFGGIGLVDYPDTGTVSGDGSIWNQESNVTCWGCAVACEGHLGAGTGKHKYEAGNRRSEYETLAAFGGYLL